MQQLQCDKRICIALRQELSGCEKEREAIHVYSHLTFTDAG